MSRIANFIVISFALLSDAEKVMSCKGNCCYGTFSKYKCFYKSYICILTGNHTVGIVSGSEDYDVLKASCKDLFAEINELVDEGEIEVDGHKVPLEFYLSGDYKVRENIIYIIMEILPYINKHPKHSKMLYGIITVYAALL